MAIKVGVNGAAGKMGKQVCLAVLDDPELELAGCADVKAGGREMSVLLGRSDTTISCAPSLDDLLKEDLDVVVDFTHPSSAMENVKKAINAGVDMVVGTTGLSGDDLEEIKTALEGSKSHIFVAPNFAIGAVLMMELAQRAVKYMPACEIIELHHDQKADAPSGTAAKTAQDLGKEPADRLKPGEKETFECARGAVVDGVHVHSVRLPGLVAHQEVIFGGLGQTLTIRHDSINRESFMPGVVMAIKAVRQRPGLTYGLENLLEV